MESYSTPCLGHNLIQKTVWKDNEHSKRTVQPAALYKEKMRAEYKLYIIAIIPLVNTWYMIYVLTDTLRRYTAWIKDNYNS